MKAFLFFVSLIIFGIGFRYGLLLRNNIRACNIQYQESLDTLASQSQTVLADNKTSCINSYTLLGEWDACLVKARDVVPETLVPVMGPVVSNIMMFFREKKKDIAVLKQEHDTRCTGHTELLFFPDATQ